MTVPDWLDSRRPAPPPTLRAHLDRRVPPASRASGESALPEHLAAAGRALLERVLSHPAAGRDLALDLLAADALVTYAFEAQAEADPGRLVELARRVAGGRP
ncbi:MAG TPA: hypothetical protein VIV10_13010 [Gemmatimonadales bacterium]